MKIAYLILAHKYPEALTRLINRLQGPEVHFFIHIDKKSDFKQFEGINNLSSVDLYSTYNTGWGSYNLIKAEVLLLEKAVNEEFDRIILLSGQDYPIKSNSYIKQFFASHPDKGFVEGIPMPDPNWNEHQGGLFRINRFHFKFARRWRAFPPHSKKPIIGKLFNAAAHLYFKKRFDRNSIPDLYHGSQWWAITLKQAKYILQQMPLYHQNFKHSYVADEMLIQTILYNAPFAPKELTGFHLHYISWPSHASPNPRVLTEQDLPALLQSDKLYARKFEPEKSTQVLKELDYVLEQPTI